MIANSQHVIPKQDNSLRSKQERQIYRLISGVAPVVDSIQPKTRVIDTLKMLQPVMLTGVNLIL